MFDKIGDDLSAGGDFDKDDIEDILSALAEKMASEKDENAREAAMKGMAGEEEGGEEMHGKKPAVVIAIGVGKSKGKEVS